MDLMLFVSFLVVSVGLIVIPGPNVLLIISTSISHGKTRGLQTVVGTSVGLCIQLSIAALGTTWFVGALAQGFQYLKWFGIAYLAYLGVCHLYRACKPDQSNPELGATSTFSRGFFVSLTNPKTILFFSAFLPQFITPNAAYGPQIIVLSLTFLILAVLLDSCWALLAGKFQRIFRTPNLQRLQNGISGSLYLGASAWLASIRRM